VQTCPLCRSEIEFGKDLTIVVEDIDKPNQLLLDIHLQILFLHQSSFENRLCKKGDYWLKQLQQRYKSELEGWNVTVHKTWNMDERLVKPILLNSFISDGVFDQYVNHFTEKMEDFFKEFQFTGLDLTDVPNMMDLLPNPP
jgi:hypothetical protein